MESHAISNSDELITLAKQASVQVDRQVVAILLRAKVLFADPGGCHHEQAEHTTIVRTLLCCAETVSTSVVTRDAYMNSTLDNIIGAHRTLSVSRKERRR